MITSFQRKIHGLIGMGRAMNVRKIAAGRHYGAYLPD